jgi:hypothetical protein
MRAIAVVVSVVVVAALMVAPMVDAVSIDRSKRLSGARFERDRTGARVPAFANCGVRPPTQVRFAITVCGPVQAAFDFFRWSNNRQNFGLAFQRRNVLRQRMWKFVPFTLCYRPLLRSALLPLIG